MKNVDVNAEQKRWYVIQQLHLLGIYETVKGMPVEKSDYRSLVATLAKARVVAQ